ncbi:MAG: ATP synthase gamma chain [Candidatus Woesebacteria bacterium GW2011_GWA1_37_7]|uniref:ATP synthase gamma chain n=1 Tax=Candidatus Woesebacteria bacterium GW2011_GWA1_37_7 TaxID=1618545 RepID=A0A0G0H1Y3_9BACT|nr:MAG: ATP synthase gamma chain [Candidatus Woesebacteria bacterium GW2011_GWA1_37_7]
MANPRLIKKRVNSIKNIKKITKALEMVSASKVLKAQSKALAAKPYAEKIYEIIANVAGEVNISEIPLLRKPKEIKRNLYIVISTNRGLAGSLNTNLFRKLGEHSKESGIVDSSFITVGKKGRGAVAFYGTLLADFSEGITTKSVPAIINLVSDKFVNEEVDAVYLVYNDFISALSQDPVIKKILPITYEKPSFDLLGKEANVRNNIKLNIVFNFEPSREEVLKELLPFYLEVILSEALYEAEASEHSARMVAMKSASDNAQELSSSLTLEFNKARQSMITNEINDITVASSVISEND